MLCIRREVRVGLKLDLVGIEAEGRIIIGVVVVVVKKKYE